jgi:hypothetical protein
VKRSAEYGDKKRAKEAGYWTGWVGYWLGFTPYRCLKLLAK